MQAVGGVLMKIKLLMVCCGANDAKEIVLKKEKKGECQLGFRWGVKIYFG